MIGDKDPEDAYDAGDPVPVQVDVLIRVVDHLQDVETDGARLELRRVDALRLVANLERRRVTDPRLAGVRRALEGLA